MNVQSELQWETIVSFSDLPSANVLADRLRSDGFPTLVTSDSHLLGEARQCQVRVPIELARRARWLLAQSQFTDEELDYLATGKLGDDQASP
jgi:hypothetical protein